MSSSTRSVSPIRASSALRPGEPGRVEGRVQAAFLTAAQHDRREGRLELALSPADGHLFPGRRDQTAVLADLPHHLVDRHLAAVPHVPGVGIGQYRQRSGQPLT